MGGRGSGRKVNSWSSIKSYGALDRDLGSLTERIRRLRSSVQTDQQQWLDLADGGAITAQATIEEFISKRRLAMRQLGAIEYFCDLAEKGEPYIRQSKPKESL